MNIRPSLESEGGTNGGTKSREMQGAGLLPAFNHNREIPPQGVQCDGALGQVSLSDRVVGRRVIKAPLR